VWMQPHPDEGNLPSDTKHALINKDSRRVGEPAAAGLPPYCWDGDVHTAYPSVSRRRDRELYTGRGAHPILGSGRCSRDVPCSSKANPKNATPAKPRGSAAHTAKHEPAAGAAPGQRRLERRLGAALLGTVLHPCEMVRSHLFCARTYQRCVRFAIKCDQSTARRAGDVIAHSKQLPRAHHCQLAAPLGSAASRRSRIASHWRL